MPHRITAQVAAALVLLSAPASAQILSSFAWIQGAAGPNFGVGHVDLDTATGELSAWSEYQGLIGELSAVEVRDASGALLAELDFDGLHRGFAGGSVVLSATALDDATANGVELRFLTSAFPSGEMGQGLTFPEGESMSLVFDGEQVVAGPGGAGLSGTLHLSRFRDGRVFFSGGPSVSAPPFTAIELRGPAYFGEVGPLVLDLQPFNSSNLGHRFLVELPPGTLDAAALQDLDGGLLYVLTRTAEYPGGALRAQTTTRLSIGDTYCAPRGNSTSQIGAQLTAAGDPRVSVNDLSLRVQYLPAGTFALPLAGRGTGHVFLPGNSRGVLCLGGASIARLSGNLLQSTSDLAVMEEQIDLTTLPPEAGLIVGETLQFQLWYRDQDGGTPTSNFSGAVRVRMR